MSRFLYFISLLLIPLLGSAQALTGSWQGTLVVNDNKLPLLFHVTTSAMGYVATMDSPNQGVRGLQVDSVTVRGTEVCFTMSALRAVYRGVLLPNEMLAGIFSQAGIDLPLMLTRQEPKYRPQEPKAPYPYICRDVVVASRSTGVVLNGTLTLPAIKPKAAVVMVTGSGIQDRNEEIFGHKPFWVIADHLTRNGIAVLRYDDRGFGVSAEERKAFVGTTTADLAQDALGALDLMQSLSEIDGCPIGILGHSEGGTIGFIAASQEPKVSFVISLAGSFIRGDRILLQQNRWAMEQQGVSAVQIAARCDLLEQAFTAVRDLSFAELTTKQVNIKARLASATGEGESSAVWRNQLLRIVDAVAASPWLHYFISYDPAEAIRKIGYRPVLALNGNLDRQVDAEENLSTLKRLSTNHQQLTVKQYDGLNHLFQPCKTGNINEYEQIETTIAHEVLTDLVEWIEKLK